MLSITLFISLNPLPVCQLFKILKKKNWPRDISRDLLTQHLYTLC